MTSSYDACESLQFVVCIAVIAVVKISEQALSIIRIYCIARSW